jgi:hypothetical protein
MILLARTAAPATNFLHPQAQPRIPSALAEESRRAHWLWPNRASGFLAAGGAHPALLGPGVGVFELPELPARDAESPVNHGGNLEVSWPSAEYPLGRVVAGNQMSALYRDFFRRQGAQAPLLELDLGFLLVKHVDEVAYFLPGRRIAVPAPELGRRLLATFYRAHPDPAQPLFLKGTKLLSGTLSSVERAGVNYILRDTGVSFAPVRAGMYLHIFRGPGRGQTYDILSVRPEGAVTVERDAAALFSYWRAGPPEAPQPGSEYLIADQPLHDTRGRVLLVSISELLDRHNLKAREFWEGNTAAGRAIRERVLPAIRELSPAQLLELPVLFEHTQSSGQSGATAFTPNLVNGHLFGATLLLPQPFVLRLPSGADLFQNEAASVLRAAGLAPQFVDMYFPFHNLYGEIHCAGNLILEPPAAPNW